MHMLLVAALVGVGYLLIVAVLEHRQRTETHLQHERVIKDFYHESGSYYDFTGYRYEDGDYKRGDDVFKADGTLVVPRCPSYWQRWRKIRNAEKSWKHWNECPPPRKRKCKKRTLLLALASVVTAATAAARGDEWKQIVELNDSIIYVRFPTPSFGGHPIKIWSLQDFKEVHTTAGHEWQSRVKLEEYDCANDRTTTDEVIFYPERMGKGYPVQTLRVNEREIVVPGTLGEVLFKAACSA